MTIPNAVVHPQSPGLLGDEAELFGRHNEHLVRSVRHAVCASDALIEDACSFAWMQLIRCQPRRETAFAWLRMVAIREAWALSRRERRALSLDEPGDGDGGGLVDTIAGVDLDATVEARDALRCVAALRPLHRRTFARHVAGLSYEEIAVETGQTWRQVSRHLTRSREALQGPVVVP